MAKKGVKFTEKHKKKLSEAKKGSKNHFYGKKFSDEHKKKLSEIRKGKASGMLGKKHSTETKRKMVKAHTGTRMPESHRIKLREANLGEKCNFWKGGVWKDKYSAGWTKTLRRAIRERDNYICKLCGELQGDITHHIHHIDYDKTNHSPDNLITLCRRCHSKTGTNRNHWKEFFRMFLTQ